MAKTTNNKTTEYLEKVTMMIGEINKEILRVKEKETADKANVYKDAEQYKGIYKEKAIQIRLANVEHTTKKRLLFFEGQLKVLDLLKEATEKSLKEVKSDSK